MQMIAKPTGGAGIIGYIWYNRYDQNKNLVSSTLAVPLGEETGGNYKHQYNVACGKCEQKDGIFSATGRPNLWNTAIRELGEEFGYVNGININVGQPRVPDLHIGSTPFWVGSLAPGTSRKSFVPNSEMKRLDFITIESILQLPRNKKAGIALTVDGMAVTVSSFAIAAIQDAFMKRLIH